MVVAIEIDKGVHAEVASNTVSTEAIHVLVRAIHEALLRCPEDFSYGVRPVDLQDIHELQKISALVQRNFREHPHYKIPETTIDGPLNEKVLQKYLEANSLENLSESMRQNNAFSFVVEQSGEILGFLLCKVGSDGSLKVHRLHTSLNAKDRGVHGVGKTLLNMAAITARRLGISKLTSTASFPAKEYFEKMGWVGKLEKNEFPFGNGESVILTQFRCSFVLNEDFEGF